MAYKCGRGCLIDLDVHELPYTRVAFVKDHYLVLLGASEQLFSGLLRKPFDEYLKSLAYVPLVALLGELILKIDHALQSVELYLFRYVVFEFLCSISPGTFGVFEHESRVVSDFSHEV